MIRLEREETMLKQEDKNCTLTSLAIGLLITYLRKRSSELLQMMGSTLTKFATRKYESKYCTRMPL